MMEEIEIVNLSEPENKKILEGIKYIIILFLIIIISVLTFRLIKASFSSLNSTTIINSNDTSNIIVNNNDNIYYKVQNILGINNKDLDEIIINKTNYKNAYIKNDTYIYHVTNEDKNSLIERYQKVYFIENDDYYSLIESNEEYYYILNEMIELLPESFVEIDISNQGLYMYKGNDIILISDVVTGTVYNETHTGYFSVYQKIRNTYLTGPTWKSYVNYWMAFDGAIGMHDASWRDEFGGEIYKDNGSHGCVNLPNDIAKELYENIEIGTRVLVHN